MVKISTEMSKEQYQWLEKEAREQHRTLGGQISHIVASYRKRLESGVPVIKRGTVVAMQRDNRNLEESLAAIDVWRRRIEVVA